jgi:ATP-dependent helicase Lhr and Lhr-like helicase
MPTQDAAPGTPSDPLAGLASPPVRDWFTAAFPAGPTPAQRLAWPVVAAAGPMLLVSDTGTGKTLAAFLAIVDRLLVEHAEGRLGPGLRCVYVSPLRSLGYDIERNLAGPLDAIRARLGLERSPVRVGVRTGDTSAHQRRKLRDAPPHLLITTPESLALLLSQPAWHPHWRGVDDLIVDEVHALVPTKRGADLAVSLERLAARAAHDPPRLGLSATCRPAEPVARYLVGPGRSCTVVDAPPSPGAAPSVLEVESLLRPDEAPHRGLTYRRLLRRLACELGRNRTTVVFANTRAFTEKITHDLRQVISARAAGDLSSIDTSTEAIAAHHSALDARRRHQVESALKAGTLRAVVTSTSLELGVDIGSADLTVQVGLPGGVARLLQRVGRSGHRVGVASRGLVLAATPAELAGAVVTASAARAGRVEPLRHVRAPLDVVCQQLVGMACEGEWSCDAAYALLRRSAPMETLARSDFDDCLAFLAGDLAAPGGADEPEPGARPRWTSPRLWRRGGFFGVRGHRVARWLRSNIGTINSEESARVLADGVAVGTLEGSYAERLGPGDRFVLDGRALEFRRLDGLVVQAKAAGGDPALPRWTSDRQSLTAELAAELAAFRISAAQRLADGPQALRAWLCDAHELDPAAAAVLVALFEAQERLSEVPGPDTLLVEEYPHDEGLTYTFHAPLSRAACEVLGRASGARLGRRFGRDLTLSVADLGWSIRLPGDARLTRGDLDPLLDPAGLCDDVLEGLDRGDLPARRFRHVASTALMVLKNPEGGRRRVGGLLWVSTRLYPLVRAACPDHPLLRETRREVLDDLLDTPAALAWLARRPTVRLRVLEGPSPFAAAWVEPGAAVPGMTGGEALRFESPSSALRRLHARLVPAPAAARSTEVLA